MFDHRFGQDPRRRHAHGPFGRDRHDREDRHGDRRPGRGFGRRPGRGRIFDHGELRYAILDLIAEQPRHGYEIIRTIEERTGGSYAPSPGLVYPTLTMLEELGHASVVEADGRKLYAATEAGRAVLAASVAELESVRGRMREARAAQGDGPPPQVVRAAENLKLAMRFRLARAPLTEAEREALAAILDAAALAVERS